MNNSYRHITNLLNQNKSIYFENESMKKHTTFGIGGKVRILIYPQDLNELIQIIKTINKNKIKFHFIGSGSNLLVGDKNLKCIIVSLKKTFKKILFNNNTVNVEAGVMLGTLVKELNKRDITGYESLIGVPGTVGGALIMNAGAFGSEISNNFISARTITNNGIIKEYDYKKIIFSYRESSFPKNEILIDALFKCKKGNNKKINERKMASSKERKEKQPLKYRSAGSIFKNPSQKIAAGYLIDKANLKGFQIGGAQISEKHANFIINTGNASSNDVIELINIIKKKVYMLFKIKLELEIKLIGIK